MFSAKRFSPFAHKISGACLGLCWFTFSSAANALFDQKVVVRLVDHECKPQIRRELVVEQFAPQIPFNAGSRHIDRVITDDRGFTNIDLFRDRLRGDATRLRFYAGGGDGSPDETSLLREIEARQRGWAYKDGKSYAYDDFAELRRATEEDPLYLYLPADPGTREADLHGFSVMHLSSEEPTRLEIGEGSLDIKASAVLVAQLENGRPKIVIRTDGSSGVVRIDKPAGVRDFIALYGHKEAIAIEVPDGRSQHTFHLLGPGGQWSMLLALDLDYEPANSALLYSLFEHSRRSATRDRIKAHAVEACGGVLSRGPTGSLARLTDDEARFIRTSHIYRNPAQVHPMERLRAALADPTLGIDQVRARLPDGPLDEMTLRAILNNNAFLPERNVLVWERAGGNEGVRSMVAIDPRTPERIVREYYDQDRDRRIFDVVLNSGLTEPFISELLDAALRHSEVQRREELLANIVKLPHAGEQTRQRTFDYYLSGLNVSGEQRDSSQAIVMAMLNRPDMTDGQLDALAASYFRTISPGSLERPLMRRAANDFRFRRAWLQRLASSQQASGPFTRHGTSLRRIWTYVLRFGELDDAERRNINNWMQEWEYEPFECIGCAPPEITRRLELDRILRDAKAWGPDEPHFDANWSESTQTALALNLATPPEILAGIFEGTRSYYVVRLLAGNPRTPPDVLDRIWLGQYFTVQSPPPESHNIAIKLYCNPTFDDQKRIYLPNLLRYDCARESSRYR